MLGIDTRVSSIDILVDTYLYVSGNELYYVSETDTKHVSGISAFNINGIDSAQGWDVNALFTPNDVDNSSQQRIYDGV